MHASQLAHCTATCTYCAPPSLTAVSSSSPLPKCTQDLAANKTTRWGAPLPIVNYKWKSFIVEGSQYTDPMGMGIINSIDLRLDDYFLCTTLTTGYATMHSRIKQRHQQQPSSTPVWLKRLTTQEYLEYLTSERISKARLKGWLVLVQSDFNHPFQHNTNNPSQLETWMAVNQLSCPNFDHLQRKPGYHTRNAGGESQTETAVDHSMHTPLPANILLEEVGVVNSEARKQFSDHLPVWLRLTLTSQVRTVPIRNPIKSPTLHVSNSPSTTTKPSRNSSGRYTRASIAFHQNSAP